MTLMELKNVELAQVRGGTTRRPSETPSQREARLKAEAAKRKKEEDERLLQMILLSGDDNPASP